MMMTDDQIFQHLDKLVASMLSPVLLDRQFLIMNCDEDSDDDGG